MQSVSFIKGAEILFSAQARAPRADCFFRGSAAGFEWATDLTGLQWSNDDPNAIFRCLGHTLTRVPNDLLIG